MAETGTLLIADDHEVFRFGLAGVIRRSLPRFHVVEASTFDEALGRLEDAKVSVAILDLGMPGLGSIADLMQIRRRRPDVRLIVLSGSDARDDVLAALTAGAHGYIVKNESTDQLLTHIRTIIGGTIYVPPSLADLPDETERWKPENPNAGAPATATLTERQRDVLRLVAQGLSNKRIAHVLSISEGTVKMHITAILRITGASNRAQAAALGRPFPDEP